MIKQKKLPPTTREKLPEISFRVSGLSELDALWLFGSYARGEETPLSDVDFAYLAEPGSGSLLSPFDVRLYRELSGFLETDETTLIDLQEAPPALALRVLQEGELLFCRDSLRVAELTERVLARHPEARRLIDEALGGEAGGGDGD